MGKSRGVTDNPPDPRAAFTPLGELFYSALIEGGGGGAAILHEDLCEFTASSHSRGENALNNALFQKSLSSHKGIVVATWILNLRLVRGRPMRIRLDSCSYRRSTLRKI